MDADGYVRFVGRDDDVITSAGYRIGPGEIEDCLIRPPGGGARRRGRQARPLRTEIVKAYVVPKDGFAPRPHWPTRSGLRAQRLSAHEYPREVEFVATMPLTTSGKVIRQIFRERARREVDGQG